MPECRLADDAISFALHQLTAQQREAFRAHLDGCAACRIRVAELEERVGLLALAAPPASPPADLKVRVTARVAEEAAREVRRRRWTLPAWAAAAAVVAVIIGSYALVQVDRLRTNLESFARAVPVEQTVVLTGTGDAPLASGRMLVARETGGTRLTLQVQGLQPLAAGQVYQLWLIKDGKRTNGGVFVVDATGKGGLATWLPEKAEWDSCGVTLEPDAFGLQPKGTKVMGSKSWSYNW
jgi:anti-sigma-K factor RskA